MNQVGTNRSARDRSSPLGLIVLASVLAGCSGDGELERPSPLTAELAIEYPLELWDQGIEGESLLKVRVNDLGFVDSVIVVEPSGYPAFDSAAIRGAREMRFRPARKDGRRIEVWARVPVYFSKKPR